MFLRHFLLMQLILYEAVMAQLFWKSGRQHLGAKEKEIMYRVDKK